MRLDRDILSKDWVIELLSKPLLARLATADLNNCQPHVVPVWFYWDGESIWVSSFKSTRKVKNLLHNPRISIIIDTGQENPPTRAVLLEGKANLLTETKLVQHWSSIIYRRYLDEVEFLKPDPQSWIIDPDNAIIKLQPEKVIAWGLKD